MVDHEIHHEIELGTQLRNIFVGAEGGIDHPIIYGGESPIRRTGIEGQNMQAADHSSEMPMENILEVLQIPS